MQPKTEDIPVELETLDHQERQPKSFELYEEYSQRDIAETIQKRKAIYEQADPQTREELEAEVEIEVENFHIWLESAKKLKPFKAHYYSISLKSLLLGLPIGVQIAWSFDITLEKLETQ